MTEVRLRPFRKEDVETVFAELGAEDASGPFQRFGFVGGGLAARVRQFEETGLLGRDRGELVVEADGTWAGSVSWRQNG